MLPMYTLIVVTFSGLAMVFAFREIARRFSFAGEKPPTPEMGLATSLAQQGTPSARGLGRLHPQFRTDHCARKPLRGSESTQMSNRSVCQRTLSGYPARWSRARFTIALNRPASS
jgi:hypothetical protein